jgi:NAD(P)-dependent dehydrogenase (short-subunit alcohol dehydrogenase family)
MGESSTSVPCSVFFPHQIGASKHAVEGYTETLDHEIRRFGVRALLVEPAYTRTSLSGTTQSARISLDVYAEERKRLTAATLQLVFRYQSFD